MLTKNKFNNYRKKIAAIAVFFVVLAVFLIVFRSPVLAQGDANELLWGGTEGAVQNEIGLGNTDPRIVIARIIQVLLGFLGILAVLIIIYAGWLWMTSEGDEQKIDKAKKILKNGLIGLIIILMAFAIVSFVISLLYGALGGGRNRPPVGPGPGVEGLGTCAIERVYPEPDQKEVPRNTSIIVTFREDVEPTTIMDASGNIIPENVRIFKEVDDDSCEWNGTNWVNCEETNVVNVRAVTSDNRTYVFIPESYLGDGLHYFNYVVYLSNDIQKTADFGGGGVFDDCRIDYFSWMFEISDKVDLTPPQVEEGGVFPFPDNDVDVVQTTTAQQATGGSITINTNPQPLVWASFGVPVSSPESPALEIVASSENTRFEQTGIITISVNQGATTASISMGGIGLGTGNINGGRIEFPNIFAVALADPEEEFDTGDSWTVNVTSTYIPSDTIRVGSINYSFVSSGEIGNQIQIGGNQILTAANIAIKLDARSDIIASAAGNVVNLTAEVAGVAGNSIAISTSDSSKMPFTPMTGGQDGGASLMSVGVPDEPRNAVIQVNFNEAMMPIKLSGKASELAEYIRVVCLSGASCDPSSEYFFDCDGSVCVEGTFEVSNQYRTVEFVSNNQCGVNACGEPIYCLPENSHLRVDLGAAHLESCTDAICTSRPPFTNCSDANPDVGHCQDGGTPPVNFPLSDQATLDGAMDVCLNSLDGNRNGGAEGPASYFNENAPLATNGDSYQWSFYISDRIEISPPKIESTTPAHGISNANRIEPVVIEFDKRMMSSSLKSGSVVIDNGQTKVRHQNINIWNFGGLALGYWLTKEDIDDDSPLDGYPDHTNAQIRHTRFGENVSYRSQAGSGVKDIYQNCMKPAVGPACPVEPYNSCCSGTESVEATCD